MENEKKLTRSSNRMIAGVCAGIAEYFGWDATLLRIVYILATFFTAFAGVIIYILSCGLSCREENLQTDMKTA